MATDAYTLTEISRKHLQSFGAGPNEAVKSCAKNMSEARAITLASIHMARDIPQVRKHL